MSFSRTLESLEAYIDVQREIIERARADIQTLIALKRDAANDPQAFAENLTEKLSSTLLLQNDLEPSGPEYIDWGLLKGCDASILHKLPIPSLKFRVSVVDDPVGTTETDVQSQLREIICDFKPRIEDALTSVSFGDESQTEGHSTPLPKLRTREQPPPKRKREEISEDDESSRPQTPVTKASPFASASPAPEPSEPSSSSTPMATGLPKAKKSKERPTLFKVPWTMQEQHLLEKCLLEIPETEKQRWVKISKAMGGIRTARQVASRVQKYNEKLKKFGLQ